MQIAQLKLSLFTSFCAELIVTISNVTRIQAVSANFLDIFISFVNANTLLPGSVRVTEGLFTVFWAKDLLVEEEMEKRPPARYFRTVSIAY